jgi:hypothetical protein
LVFYIYVMKRGFHILALLLTLALIQGGMALAQGGKNMDSAKPEALQEQLNRLRVFYTETHPDIQRLKRHLKRALEEQELKRKQKAEPQPTPDSGAASGLEPESPAEDLEGRKNRYVVIPKKNLPSP